MPDKAIEAITLHVSEGMKRDLQDVALSEDRAVGEWIRHELTVILYGKMTRTEDPKRSEEKRK